jgi:sugar lactone lactonase YvrE
MTYSSAVLVCIGLATIGCADYAAVSPAELDVHTAVGPHFASSRFPDVIGLPDGFAPEGIASGRGTTFYVTSIPTGAVYRVDAATGAGEVLFAGAADRQGVGVKHALRTDHLFVAGGFTGQGYVYDASTGATLAIFQLTPEGTGLINDVVVLPDAAYFTDSFRPVIYRVPLDNDGSLPANGAVQEIALTGDFQFVAGDINANGISAIAQDLIIVNSATGTLYRVDPRTGVATAIDLGGGSVVGGDGILLDGRNLYVVQTFQNQVSVVRLSPDRSSGTIERVITDPNFRIVSTIAEFGNALYVVNARFDVAPPPAPAPGVPFEVVRVSKR